MKVTIKNTESNLTEEQSLHCIVSRLNAATECQTVFGITPNGYIGISTFARNDLQNVLCVFLLVGGSQIYLAHGDCASDGFTGFKSCIRTSGHGNWKTVWNKIKDLDFRNIEVCFN